MPVSDPLGMLDGMNRPGWSPDADKPQNKEKALHKLRELQRETLRVQNAARQLEHTVRSNVRLDPDHGGSSKEALRNWLLSLIESFGYIEMMLGGAMSAIILRDMVKKATDLGITRAKQDGAL